MDVIALTVGVSVAFAVAVALANAAAAAAAALSACVCDTFSPTLLRNHTAGHHVGRRDLPKPGKRADALQWPFSHNLQPC